MPWTRTPPTEPGWYWWRSPYDEPKIKRVDYCLGALKVDGPHGMLVETKGGEWQGPLRPDEGEADGN